MTIVRLSSGAAAQRLLAHFHDTNDVAVELIDECVLRVSLLGSFREDAMRMELELRMRAWQEAERARGSDVELELEDADRL